MSEKQQHTAARMREKMEHRYDDGLHHKHNTCHLPYRLHWPSHPTQHADGLDKKDAANQPIGLIEIRNSKKLRKRFDNGDYH